MEPQRDPVEVISAVTLLTTDMAQAVTFYEALGFHLLYGGEDAPFTSFRVGTGYLNLQSDTAGAFRGVVWGRVVFWVDDVDAMHKRASRPGSIRKLRRPTHRGANAISTSATKTATS